ncbi:hypothetical protein RRG08_028941 [Elysia crispata]|uniref:Uncharacterized protein n=1 Tax=Elysia crispata TaxID=231223 RepID=A0AAE1AQ22_9GAST|nr:hypothetical protein RRG08_028941 [Elysia crispata]
MISLAVPGAERTPGERRRHSWICDDDDDDDDDDESNDDDDDDNNEDDDEEEDDDDNEDDDVEEDEKVEKMIKTANSEVWGLSLGPKYRNLYCVELEGRDICRQYQSG